MLEVADPTNAGSRTFRGSRFVLRSCSTLSLGPGREAETDVFAEHTIVRPARWERERPDPDEPIQPDPEEPLGL